VSELLNRFSFSTAKWDNTIAICLLAIWVIIVICAISSVRAQGFSDWGRRFWIAVIVVVPVLGLLAYLPFSFRREDLPAHMALRSSRDRSKRPVRRISSSESASGKA
jgi:uncharacterized membrane protein YhdT